jgi:hypothetical protein
MDEFTSSHSSFNESFALDYIKYLRKVEKQIAAEEEEFVKKM